MSLGHQHRPPLEPSSGYKPAVGPWLRKLLLGVFASTAVLGAGGAYLLAVRILGSVTGESYQNPFYFWMLLLHLSLGVLVIVPFLLFGSLHMRSSLRRPNRRAVRAGLWLFSAGLLLVVSGLCLIKNLGRPWHDLAYWAHVVTPPTVAALYLRHRFAGPPIAWRWAWMWGVAVAAFVGALVFLHAQDPRKWYQVGPAEGETYFEPSLSRTSTGNFIPASALLMDDYCRRCHPDAYEDWVHSAHRFSSFNNPLYRFSVLETRKVSMERDGDTRAARFCAGCHDPVPFFSGKFDDPSFDDIGDPTAQAGITCVACHAIVHVNSTRGNGDYTIEEPLHYPFATSTHPLLQWVNERLIKANPTFHKQTFLKPLHKTAEFCSACHKVHIPYEINKYKPFLRGQNHYDTYLLSGVSGHGARSFYYPERAKPNCSEGCHMPWKPSSDFGNRGGYIHDHLFPGANTALPELRGEEGTRKAIEDFLRDGQVRIDIFGLREDGTIEGRLMAPIRPEIPALRPGATYLVEVVVRTLKMGHHFTQGTVDSNEVWVDVEARSGSRTIGRSGGIDERGFVDPWSHFVNALVLDRHGDRIDRRNVQDIFVPLYDHQIPPGAAQTIHYRLDVPTDARAPVEISATMRYRKFDMTFLEHVYGEGKAPRLSPVDLCADRVVLPVEGGEGTDGTSLARPQPGRGISEWERWNDYGIGLLLKGRSGSEKGELRQAEEAFSKVASLGRSDGWVNLARVYDREGRVDDLVHALRQAIQHPEPPPPWTVTWLSGRANRQNGRLDEAIRDFERVLSMKVPSRGFDFSLDYEVRNELGLALFDRSQSPGVEPEERRELLERAREAFRVTVQMDSENQDAHYNLYLIHAHLGDREESRRHLELFNRYRPDDNAADRAHAIHRSKSPAANKAAQSIVIYDLGRRP